MSFKLKNHNIIFIHPPKCGGSSIAETLKRTGNMGEKLQNTGAHMTIENNAKMKNFTADEYFVSVRNPYSRFYSFYHFTIEWDLKRINGELKLKVDTKEELENRRQKLLDIGFNGFINLLKDKNKIKEFTDIYRLKNAFKPQHRYFLNQTDKPVHLFKIEEGTVWKYLQDLGYNVKPEHIKKSSYKTQKGYTKEQAEIVYKYFKQDFEILGYDKGNYKRA